MDLEIIEVLQRKKDASDKAKDKIDAAQDAIDLRQKNLNRAVADYERNLAVIAAMEELAEKDAVAQERAAELDARMRQILSEHSYDPRAEGATKLQDNAEYAAVKAELGDLKPQIKANLELMKKLYFGKVKL